MRLEIGQTIVLDKNEFGKYKKVVINSINKSAEKNVIDIQSKTGFVQDVDGHIHKQCGSHSIAYIIKHGLNLPTVITASGPAKHCETLIKSIASFLASINTIYSGACGLANVNTFIAPFLVGMTDKEIEQTAQSLCFTFAQTAFGKSQAIFLDCNLDITVPHFLRETKALCPGATYCKIKNDGQKDYLVECDKKEAATYWDFNKYAQKFLVAMMKILEAGDVNGVPFAFPKALCHINDESFLPENKWVFDSILKCASVNGSPYFLFDRGTNVKVAQCCRLSVDLTSKDIETVKEKPEDSRFAAMQNITINLPNAALSSMKDGKVDKSDVLKTLKETIDIAVMGHKEKYNYIKKLTKLPNSPLKFINEGMIGERYINIKDFTYLVGITGLNECVKIITGKELHESNEAYNLGLQIIAEMSIYCDKVSEESKMKIVLEETPGESANLKLAMTDCNNKDFGEKAREFVNGSYEDGSAYWQNSVHFKYDADIGFVERILKQSNFHPMIKAGAIINLYIGENLPSVASLYNLIEKVFNTTKCVQLTISPEFTVCHNCNTCTVGLNNSCKKCGSDNIYNMTRIVGYLSVIQTWNKSKKDELKHRKKELL